jgi:regulator of protease activity HflC (stomatin/prohibitin superfamily)
MSKSIAIIVGILLLIALLLFSMTYTVNFHEVAIKMRFGKTSSASIIREPGLKFRLPLFADTVTTYDTRLQLRESPLETIQTQDGQQLMVRAFMLWRVDTKSDDGPLLLFRSYPTLEEANQSLIGQFRTALRTGLSRYSFDDLIGPSSRLQDAEKTIRDEMQDVSAKGIEPVSVGISQLILPPKTSQAVMTRMQATRQMISEGERTKGQAIATGIEARAKGQADKIRSFARQRAAEITAKSGKDAEVMLKEMDKERELAIFLAWLDALQNTLTEHTTIVIPTMFAPFHLLQLATPLDGKGVPQPTAEIASERTDKPATSGGS